VQNKTIKRTCIVEEEKYIWNFSLLTISRKHVDATSKWDLIGYIPDSSWDPCWSDTCRGRRPLSGHLWYGGSTSCGRYGSQLPSGYAWSRGRVSPGSPSCPPSPNRPGNINRPIGFLMGGSGKRRVGGCGRVGAPEIAVTASRISQEDVAAISSQASDCGIQTDIEDAYIAGCVCVCARARARIDARGSSRTSSICIFLGIFRVSKNSRDLARANAHTRSFAN